MTEYNIVNETVTKLSQLLTELELANTLDEHLYMLTRASKPLLYDNSSSES